MKLCLTLKILQTFCSVQAFDYEDNDSAETSIADKAAKAKSDIISTISKKTDDLVDLTKKTVKQIKEKTVLSKEDKVKFDDFAAKFSTNTNDTVVAKVSAESDDDEDLSAGEEGGVKKDIKEKVKDILLTNNSTETSNEDLTIDNDLEETENNKKNSASSLYTSLLLVALSLLHSFV